MMPSSRCRTSTRWICSRRDRTRGLMPGSLIVPCFEQLQARFEPVDVVADAIDAVQEFLRFRAVRHVATFLLQVLGYVLQERVVRTPRETERRARSVAHLMCCDVADDARQLFLQVGLCRLEQLAESLCDFCIALDVDRATAQCS